MWITYIHLYYDNNISLGGLIRVFYYIKYAKSIIAGSQFTRSHSSHSHSLTHAGGGRPGGTLMADADDDREK